MQDDPEADAAGPEERGEALGARTVVPLVYDELRHLARAYLRPGSPPTLQPTMLVHEAYVRLADGAGFRSKTHFQAAAAVAMRHALLDHVRDGRREKRGGDWRRVTLADVPGEGGAGGLDVEELEAALTALAAVDERGAHIVELRLFGGLTEREVAELLGVSERTVRHDWSMARAWLRVRLTADGD